MHRNNQNGPSSFMLAIYGVALCGLFAVVSGQDYADQRKIECARQGTSAHDVSWDSRSDLCVKESKHGTTVKN